MDLYERLAELRHQREQIIAATRALELVATSRGRSGRPRRRGRPPESKTRKHLGCIFPEEGFTRKA
jgi:hypothetical protein